MTTTTDFAPAARFRSLGAFAAVFRRDVSVTVREFVPFLVQTVLQPLFILFVFGKVLTGMGYVDPSYAAVLLPGVVALNGFVGALQNTTLPLVLDFSWSREIEDRLLAPIPLSWVAVEKMLFGALRGLVAALVMVPIGFVVLDGVSWPASALPGVVGVVVLAALAGAAIGMTVGTAVTARAVNVAFTVILIPLMFTGSTQFPWRELDALPWFQVVCAVNPLTYASEGMRALLVPGVASIPLWVDVAVLAATTIVFGLLGMRGFRRRAVD
ncbi:hypothetical protein SUDANB95_01972 [Actinosynnema sp. ALI-1.44]